MSELDKAIEEIKEIKKFNTSGIVPRWEPINVLVSTIEQLREKLNRDINELPSRTSYYYNHGLNQQRAVNLDIKDYAQEILEIIGG